MIKKEKNNGCRRHCRENLHPLIDSGIAHLFMWQSGIPHNKDIESRSGSWGVRNMCLWQWVLCRSSKEDEKFT